MAGWIVAGALAALILTVLLMAEVLSRADKAAGLYRCMLTVEEWRKVKKARGVDDNET